MDRPDFGLGSYFHIKWTPERVAYVRHCATELKMSAAAIAKDIGLDARGGPRIANACKVHGIRLQGKGGRPPRRTPPILLEIPLDYLPTLERLGIKHKRSRVEITSLLLEAMFSQGETFLENLLDLDGAGD
jgi:hypothetical protein